MKKREDSFTLHLREPNTKFISPTPEAVTASVKLHIKAAHVLLMKLQLQQFRKSTEELEGKQTEKLRKNLARLSPELSEWTVLVGYGLVLSRPGLEAGLRELLEVAVLTAQGFPRQLHSHLRGAINLGISAEKVALLLEVVEPLVAEEKFLSARQLWNDINARILPL